MENPENVNSDILNILNTLIEKTKYNNIQILKIIYDGNRRSLRLRCYKKHIFITRLNHFLKIGLCPVCKNGHKPIKGEILKRLKKENMTRTRTRILKITKILKEFNGKEFPNFTQCMGFKSNLNHKECKKGCKSLSIVKNANELLFCKHISYLELYVGLILYKNNYIFLFEGLSFDENKYYDFLIIDGRNKKILLEVDGRRNHKSEKQKKIDINYTIKAIEKGFRIIRLDSRHLNVLLDMIVSDYIFCGSSIKYKFIEENDDFKKLNIKYKIY